LKQAELLLSTQGLTSIQKQAILTELQFIGTTGKLTTAQMTEILATKEKSKADAKALLLNAGLITSETAEATATNVVTAAKLKEAIQTKALTQEEAQLIAAKAGVTLANQKESVSFLGNLRSKMQDAGVALKGFGTGLLAIASAHPVIAGITAALSRSALDSFNLGSMTEESVLDLMQQFPELVPYIDLTAKIIIFINVTMLFTLVFQKNIYSEKIKHCLDYMKHLV
jgi:hypothetical protein